jgi:hypothetical protein
LSSSALHNFHASSYVIFFLAADAASTKPSGVASVTARNAINILLFDIVSLPKQDAGMSAIGTKRTYRVALPMSAFGGKADMPTALQNVC